MNSKYIFITKRLLLSFLPLLIIYVIFIPIEIFIFNEPLARALWSNSFFILLMFPPLELFQLFSASKRAKRLGVNLWSDANQQGNLTHTIMVADTIMHVKEKLQEGNWKYKIIDEKTEGEKIILFLKHYQISANRALIIELKDIGLSSTAVTFNGNWGRTKWWTLVFTNWTFQLKQIEYFQNIILQQEELNKHLSFIS